LILGSTNVGLLKLKSYKENFFSSFRVTYTIQHIIINLTKQNTSNHTHTTLDLSIQAKL